MSAIFGGKQRNTERQHMKRYIGALAMSLVSAVSSAETPVAKTLQKAFLYRINRGSFSALNNANPTTDRYTNFDTMLGRSLGVFRWGASFPVAFVQGADVTSGACPTAANNIVITAVDQAPVGVERSQVVACGNSSYVITIFLQSANQANYVWGTSLSCNGANATASQAANDALIDMSSLFQRAIMRQLYGLSATSDATCIGGNHTTILEQNRVFAQSHNQLCNEEIAKLSDVYGGYFSQLMGYGVSTSADPMFPFFTTTSPYSNSVGVPNPEFKSGMGGYAQVWSTENIVSPYYSSAYWFFRAPVDAFPHNAVLYFGNAPTASAAPTPPGVGSSYRKPALAAVIANYTSGTTTNPTISAALNNPTDDTVDMFLLVTSGTAPQPVWTYIGKLQHTSVRTGAVVPVRTRMPVSIAMTSSGHSLVTYVDRDASERLCTDSGAQLSGFGGQNLIRVARPGSNNSGYGHIPLDKYRAEMPVASERYSNYLNFTEVDTSCPINTTTPRHDIYQHVFAGQPADGSFASLSTHAGGNILPLAYRFTFHGKSSQGCNFPRPQYRDDVGYNNRARPILYASGNPAIDAQRTTYQPLSTTTIGLQTTPAPYNPINTYSSHIAYLSPNNKAQLIHQQECKSSGLSCTEFDQATYMPTTNYQLFYAPTVTGGRIPGFNNSSGYSMLILYPM